MLCWFVLGLAVFEKLVLSSLAKWRCQKLMFVCYLFGLLLHTRWRRGFHRLLDVLGLVALEHHDAVHVLQMLTGPNPHIAQSRGDEDNAVALMSPFQLLLSFCIDRGQKHLEVSWVVVWSCSH